MKRTLSDKETVAYLANVLYVANADGTISAAEADMFSDIAKNIGANNNDTRKARELIYAPDFKIRLLLAPDARMSNLEDMVLIGLADDKVSELEAGPIERMAKALHYSQTDLNMAVRRAKGRLQKMRGSRTIVPPLPANAKQQPPKPPAIPKPSAPPTPPPKPTPPPPPKPAAPPPPPVKKAAKAVPAPVKQQETEKKKSVPKTKPTVEATPKPEPKAKPTPTLESKKPKKDHSPLSKCVASRNASANPTEYCFGYGSGSLNIWGCRLLRMDWATGADWLRMGAFRDSSTFVFDRAAMADKAIRRIKTTCKDCPHLNIDFIDITFDLLPSRATIRGRWIHHKADSNSEGATTVNTKENIHGCQVSKELITDGVDPVGTAGAINIIKRAVKKSGRQIPDYKLLAQD